MPAKPARRTAKLPAAIQVGPTAYEVRYATDRELPGPTKVKPGEAYKDAEADLDAAVIRIRKGLTAQRVRVLLAHEVLHTLTDLAGLDKPAGPLHPRIEEMVVNQVAPLLVDVLRRNPALVAYLTAP